MKTISIAEMRHDPAHMFADVEAGETYTVTRHRRPIALIGPVSGRRKVSGAELTAAFQHVPDDGAEGFTQEWLADQRAEDVAQATDPWGDE
jgi:antitoxin (DNA-binding transcriptional repressor) of toxin-antitoxin stability system